MFRTQLPVLCRTSTMAQRAVTARSFQMSARPFARKDSQDRESMNTESNEYSKSSGDENAARATEDTAFSRDKTRPEEQLGAAEKEVKGTDTNNPLDASPANHEMGKPVDKKNVEGSVSEQEGRQTGDRSRTSGGGSAPKHG